MRAHPRACGENGLTLTHASDAVGSSPRMRGKLDKIRSLAGGDRLIPAHAGKTPRSGTRDHPRAAHPRACGENAPTATVNNPAWGSSPRMRGKLIARYLQSLRAGLIPAHAGKTSGRFAEHPLTWAHPRACGENFSNDNTKGNAGGSSPRMRGKHADEVAGECGGGAHPRVCGENWSWSPDRPRRVGSSPRVRGKPDGTAIHLGSSGLIPACAGKTVQKLVCHVL